MPVPPVANELVEKGGNETFTSIQPVSRQVAHAAPESMEALKSKVKTITFDNGPEFAEHEKIA